ncbi:MAG: hypothetical protein WBO55_06820 [Rhizobiaceae bacterium]
MAVHDHPTWAEVGVASAATVSRGKVVQSGIEVGQVTSRNGLGLPGATPSVRGATTWRRANVEGVVLAHPCQLRLEKRWELVRDFLCAEAMPRGVVADWQVLWARQATSVGKFAGVDFWLVRGRGARPRHSASTDDEDCGRQADQRTNPAHGPMSGDNGTGEARGPRQHDDSTDSTR